MYRKSEDRGSACGQLGRSGPDTPHVLRASAERSRREGPEAKRRVAHVPGDGPTQRNAAGWRQRRAGRGDGVRGRAIGRREHGQPCAPREARGARIHRQVRPDRPEERLSAVAPEAVHLRRGEASFSFSPRAPARGGVGRLGVGCAPRLPRPGAGAGIQSREARRAWAGHPPDSSRHSAPGRRPRSR